MSVYSGFATRQQQNKYNFLLETLVVTLKKRLIKFYKKEQCDQTKFKLLVKKIYKKMYLLQKGKYMTPKYSTCFTDLIDNLNIDINYDSMSDVSSMMSQTFSLRKDPLNNSNTNDPQDDNLKSRTILQSKRNLLESHRVNNATTLNLSQFSLKKPYFNTLNVQNQEDLVDGQKANRSVSLGKDQSLNFNALKGKVKLRKLEELKNLRGTMHMPKVQDFMPKKQQIQPAFFRKPPIMLDTPKQHRGGYRRQKYSRAQINVEDL